MALKPSLGDLPSGRRGQALALGIALLVLGLLWFGLAMPLFTEYEDRAAILASRRERVDRMARLVDELPTLEARLVAPAAAGTVEDVLLTGETDAIAGANLQQLIQERAARAGMSLTSLEMLPTTVAGDYRRIGLRVSATAAWPVLVPLLASLPRNNPRLLIDDLQIHGPGIAWQRESELRVSFTVQAFRAASAPATQTGTVHGKAIQGGETQTGSAPGGRPETATGASP